MMFPSVRLISIALGRPADRQTCRTKRLLLDLSTVATFICETVVYNIDFESYYSAPCPPRSGTEYCDERVCLFVCVSVCLSASISPELHVQSSRILCMLPWLGSPPTGVAMCYVFPVCGWRHVCIFAFNGQEYRRREKDVCSKWLARLQHISRGILKLTGHAPDRGRSLMSALYFYTEWFLCQFHNDL